MTATIPPPVQNSSFSFKHFLSGCNISSLSTASVAVTNSIATTTTTTTTQNTAIGNHIVSNMEGKQTNGVNIAGNKVNSKSPPLQTSTGARPKVSQSYSTSTSMSMLGNGSNQHGSSDTINSTVQSRMKRSPRFSSFDSKASLAEYTNSANTKIVPAIIEVSANIRNHVNNSTIISNLYSGDVSTDEYSRHNHEYGGKD